VTTFFFYILFNLFFLVITKAGHLQFKVRNSAILRTTKSIAELRNKKVAELRLWNCDCGTAIADLKNLTSAIPQLSAVSCKFRYFLVPFPQLRMVLKINQKYF
jgi:hypothetical protein